MPSSDRRFRETKVILKKRNVFILAAEAQNKQTAWNKKKQKKSEAFDGLEQTVNFFVFRYGARHNTKLEFSDLTCSDNQKSQISTSMNTARMIC